VGRRKLFTFTGAVPTRRTNTPDTGQDMAWAKKVSGKHGIRV